MVAGRILLGGSCDVHTELRSLWSGEESVWSVRAASGARAAAGRAACRGACAGGARACRRPPRTASPRPSRRSPAAQITSK